MVAWKSDAITLMPADAEPVSSMLQVRVSMEGASQSLYVLQ